MKKVNKTIRFDQIDLTLASNLFIDVADLCRKALKREIKKKRQDKCPKCGEVIL